jgi:hypothetical protein
MTEQQQEIKDFLGKTHYSKGDIIGIVLHCGFSTYYEVDQNCHFSILGDGQIKITCQSVLEEKKHVYRRSKRRIGVSVSCLKGAKTPPRDYVPDMASYPQEYGEDLPTKHQIDALVWLVTFLVDYFRLDPNQVMSHASWALKDNYFPSNAWGLDRWGEPVMGDTAWDWWKEERLLKAMIFGWAFKPSMEKTEN